jgi:hypothetical protein
METRTSIPTWSCGSALAVLVAAAEMGRFSPTMRLHDRALFELSELATSGRLNLDTANWRFAPSPNGGYALVGLADVLLILSEEGWLRRDPIEVAYVVSPEFRDWGARALGALSAVEQRRVGQVARRWKARAVISSKNVA